MCCSLGIFYNSAMPLRIKIWWVSRQLFCEFELGALCDLYLYVLTPFYLFWPKVTVFCFNICMWLLFTLFQNQLFCKVMFFTEGSFSCILAFVRLGRVEQCLSFECSTVMLPVSGRLHHSNLPKDAKSAEFQKHVLWVLTKCCHLRSRKQDLDKRAPPALMKWLLSTL